MNVEACDHVVNHIEAALLTSPSPGAIAVIALRGRDVPKLLQRILRTPRGEGPPNLIPERPTLCRVVDEGRFEDDAVVTVSRGGSSPGDPACAELSIHGGPRIVQRVLVLLQREGARLVPADEFVASHSAVGADDVIVHDVDGALLRARSRRLVRWLLAQRGILPQFLAARGTCDPSLWNDYLKRSAVGMRLIHGMSIALVGPPNSGKSTLANRFIGADRMITSDVPGTTRDWVSETILIDGWPVTLTDTAGHRESDCAIETEAIRRGAAQAQAADLVLLVLDGSLPDDELIQGERRLRASIPEQARVLCVLNKSDLSRRSAPPDAMSAFMLSARTGEGMDLLDRAAADELRLHLLEDALPTGFLERHLLPPAPEQ